MAYNDSRIRSLRAKMAGAGLDALYVRGLSNVAWLTGFEGYSTASPRMRSCSPQPIACCIPIRGIFLPLSSAHLAPRYGSTAHGRRIRLSCAIWSRGFPRIARVPLFA